MREIKFRALRKSGEYMDYDPHVGCAGSEDYEVNDAFDDKDQIFMQFTGLHDKNGKAIYEGDVVEWDSLLMDCITTEKRRVEIKYVANYHEYLTDDPSRGVSAIFTFPRTSNAQTIEVVGNIYENPNLITGKKDLYE